VGAYTQRVFCKRTELSVNYCEKLRQMAPAACRQGYVSGSHPGDKLPVMTLQGYCKGIFPLPFGAKLFLNSDGNGRREHADFILALISSFICFRAILKLFAQFKIPPDTHSFSHN
jgi:hypothetical protein